MRLNIQQLVDHTLATVEQEREKLASPNPKTDIGKALLKVAEDLRKISIEVSYEDLDEYLAKIK